LTASSRTLERIAESTAITIAVPAVGYAVDHADPFFLHSRFPWLAFAPLLVALRHGFSLGFGSAVALGVALVIAWRTRLVPIAGFPGEPLVGLVALAMVAGQFADLWKREAMRLEDRLSELRREADSLVRSHVLLEASHDRLDEQLQRKASHLRDAMRAANDLLITPSNRSLSKVGDVVMEVFAAYCGLEIGELFSVERKATIGERCAAVGRVDRMKYDDPLLVRALRSGRLTYVPAALVPDRDRDIVRSPLLAAVPFVDGSGVVRGVLCVQAMPFTSFDERNLDTMMAIAKSFAERLYDEPGDRGEAVWRVKEARA